MTSDFKLASWNPLKITGTPLPPTVLLMVKIVAMGWILKGYIADLPEPHIPFLPLFEVFSFSAVYKLVIQILFVAATVLLFLNRYVRTCCIVMALIIFTSILACRFYYSNNKIYCACLFFLSGLLKEGEKPTLLRLQIALMYFGAAFNKILDVDWRTGEYFDYFLGKMIRQPYYLKLSQKLPALLLAKFLSWGTIITEFFLSIGFFFRRCYPLAIWTAIYFHSSALAISTKDFGIYTTALMASYLVFLDWPQKIVIYYKRTGYTNWIQKVIKPLMWDGVFQWIPMEGDEKDSPLTVKTEKNTLEGFMAFKCILLYWPVFFVAIALLLCSSPAQYVWWRTKGVELLLIIFCPLYDLFYFWHQKKKNPRN